MEQKIHLSRPAKGNPAAATELGSKKATPLRHSLCDCSALPFVLLENKSDTFSVLIHP